MRFVVSGWSMEPTFAQGDKLYVSGLFYKFIAPRAGDVVVVRDPRDGRLILKRIDEVNRRGYFVIGDNQSLSTDSRAFGIISRTGIVGKAIMRYSRR